MRIVGTQNPQSSILNPPLLLLVALCGCAAVNGSADQRTATWTVDEKRRAFTLAIDEAGRAPLRIEGDASGKALPDAQRRALLQYLDATIERLDGVKGAEADVAWMKRFREAYTR